jgi:hypothetical protein
MADAALRRVDHPLSVVSSRSATKDDLRREAALLPIRHGASKARRAVEFADGRADRPGESISRANMHLAQIPAPELQVPMTGGSGRRYVVDFWWPQFEVIGEFDGKIKYSDPVFLDGRTPQQAVYDEKLREDDLRATGKGMSRWPWEVAVSPQKLRTHLARAGIR